MNSRGTVQPIPRADFAVKPFTHGAWRGEIVSPSSDLLEALLSMLESPSDARVLKEGRARKVWVGAALGRGLLIKEYRTPRWEDRLAALLRGSRAALEWRSAKRLAERGVPIPQPILWGEHRGAEGEPRGVVVFEFVADGQPISEFMNADSRLSPEMRRAMFASLGSALGKLHRAGAEHGDAHPGNLLVTRRSGKPEVLILDLHQVRRRRTLAWRKRLTNLGQFLAGQGENLSTGSKQRCLQAYLEALGDWSPPFPSEREARRSMGRAVEFFAHRAFRGHWRSRLAKCVREGKRFHRLRLSEYSGWVRAEWDNPALREALADPNALFSGPCSTLLKDTPTTSVARVALPGLLRPLFAKRYNRKGPWERIKNLFRRSRAMKVWRSAYALEILGIPTPTTVAVLERRKGPLLLESFILTEWIEGGVGCDDFYRESRRAPRGQAGARDLRALERAVANLFRALHSHGISHGDLKGRNVLLDPSAPAPPAPRLVDLDAMTLRPMRFRRARINDLSRLLFSVYEATTPAAWVRFFREYSRRDAALWRDRRKWWSAIRRRTERKLIEKHGKIPERGR